LLKRSEQSRKKKGKQKKKVRFILHPPEGEAEGLKATLRKKDLMAWERKR